MARLSRAIAALTTPVPISRSTTLALTERLAAATHLVTSLEYLTNERDREPGGLNDWAVSRQNFRPKSKLVAKLLDLAGDRRGTKALHITRAVAAAAVLAPLPRNARLAASAVLTASALALYPRHQYGADGADQVSFLVQTAATVARAGDRNPALVDACLWFVSMQSTLSYAVSGWVKVTSRTWRSGDALPNIMRTRAYGDEQAWRLLRKYPRTGRALGTAVLALECGFPLLFLGKGRLANAVVGSAAAFHVANARLMGLGRFLWSFCAMHPAVLYTTGPRERISADGQWQRRDDLMPLVALGGVGIALAAGLVNRKRQERAVRAGRPDELRCTTTSGNTLSYRRLGPATGPVLVLENGLAATAEYWEWIADGLARRHSVVTYQRAGYGASTYAGTGEFTLDDAVADLVDLVRTVAGDRPVVLLGHSLGGYLVSRAGERLGGQVVGIGLLDTSHPHELRRSVRQGTGRHMLTTAMNAIPISLRMGLGPLLDAPAWSHQLPEHVRSLAVAHFRDPNVWTTGQREWQATQREFLADDTRLPEITVPALVVTAGQTARQDPVQQTLHDEIAAAAPRSVRRTVEHAGHFELLSDQRAAGLVAEWVHDFVDTLAPTPAANGRRVTVDAR